MSNHVRASVSMALSRMNGQPIAIRENDPTLLTNMQQMMSCDDEDFQERAEQQMRENLCAAYGVGRPSADKPFAFSNGLAIIPIHGTLINRYGGYYYGYVTGYNFIRSQRNAALADPDVEAIIYDVNSNGGEAAGCFELSQEMFDTRGEKPSLAVVDSNCYSAAYALASAADKIVVTPSGGAGSIGVIALHIDMSKMLADIGITVNIIKSGEHKADGNPYEPMSDEVRADWQASVDSMRTDFVNLVAQNRDLDPKVVRDTEAMCYNAGEAMSIGLIDAVSTPSKAVTEFLNGPSDNSPDHSGANAMSFTQEEMDAARAEAATNERTRIAGIMGCDAAANRTKLANHIAFNTNMSVEDATAMLTNSAEEPKATVTTVAPDAAAPGKPGTEAKGDNPFDTVMANADHPNAGADAGNEQEGAKETAGLMAAMSAVAGSNMAK